MARASTFTTYINAKDDPSVNSAFDRLSNKAVSTYQKIETAARSATKAQLGLVGGSGTAGASSAARSTDTQAKAVDNLARSYRSASPAVTSLITPTRNQGAAAELAARHNTQLSQSLRATASALAVAQGPMGPLAGRVLALANAAERLTGFRLGLVGVGAALVGIGRLGSNYTNLTSQVKGAFVNQERSNTAMNDIVGIANRAKVSLESVTGLYIRLSQAAAQAGVSQRDATRVTELAAKAARLSGGSSETQNAALVQFTQAYGADFKGGGQELQSINEGANQLGVAIANGLGVPLGKLKELGAQGKLSTEVVTQALLKSASDIERRYAALGNTLGGSLAILGNNATVMVGKFDQAIGFTSGLADSINVVGANLRAITGLILGVGVAVGAARVAPFIAQTIAGIQSTIEVLTREANLKRGNAIQDQFYALEAEKNSAQELVDTRARIAALAQERVAIEAKIAALQEERLVAGQQVTAARANPVGITGYSRGSAGVGLGDAEERAQAATRKLADEQERLRNVQGALATESTLLVSGQQKLALATENAMEVTARGVPKAGLLSGALGKLRSVAGGLLSLFGGPWGVALAAASTAMFLLATAETAAEKATRLNEDAQRSFELQVDKTTGKVITQGQQLELLAARAKNLEARTAASASYASVKANISSRVSAIAAPDSFQATGGTLGGGVSFKSSPTSAAKAELLRAQQAFDRGDYGSQAILQQTIQKLRGQLPELNAIAVELGGQFTQLRNAALPLQQSAARSRILTGRARDGDREKAFGEAPKPGQPKPLSSTEQNAAIRAGRISANANSDDALKKAAGERDQALADLKKQTGLTAEQMSEQAKAIQDRYNTEVTSIREARKAAAAGRVAARQEARDAIQDAKDAALAKANTALTDLYKAHPGDTTSQAFLDQRAAILKSYDDEVNKLDERAAASHRASSQILADAKKEAEAATQRGEKRTNILAQYDDSPKAIDNARKSIAELQELVGHVVGNGIYTQEMATADSRRIIQGVQRPLTEIFEKSQEQLAVNRLILDGRDAEAQALQQALDLRRQGVTVDEEHYRQLRDNYDQEQLINDALASRQRIVGEINGIIDTGRSSLTGLLTQIQSGAKIQNPLTDIKNQLFKVSATQFTEKLFAGADAKIRALLTGRSAVDKAVDGFETSVTNIDTATNKMVTSFNGAADKLNQITSAIAVPTATPGGVTGSDTGGLPSANRDNTIPIKGTDGSNPDEDIVVVGKKLVKSFTDVKLPETFKADFINPLGNSLKKLPAFKTPSAEDAGKAIFGNIGSKLDSVVDRLRGRKTGEDGVLRDANGTAVTGSKLFTGIGKAVGTALAGAGNGELASGIAKQVGLKQSKLGAQVGGAIGQTVGGPIGGFIGGLIGGTIGGLFKKTAKSSATVGFNATGDYGATNVSGTKAANVSAAKTLANSVGSQLQSIADQVGGVLNGSGTVSIGTRKDKFVVDTTGKGRTKGAGTQSYGSEEEAVAAAVQNLLQTGVISGISKASQKILASGQDLQRALTKATAIESIPKRLLALTDPVRYAVSNLNDEFAKLISYLNEGGATAEQFADAQKLYELERAQAITDATKQASDAIDTFLKNMTGSQNSPLNKRDTYASASSTLDAYRADIAAGKTVDDDKLLAAATNFQDASRNLYGSSQSFFDDFNDLQALLTKAKANDQAMTTTNTTNLPGSPFANDAGAQAAFASLKATQDQTNMQSGKFDSLISAVKDLSTQLSGVGTAGDGTSALGLLPAFR